MEFCVSGMFWYCALSNGRSNRRRRSCALDDTLIVKQASLRQREASQQFLHRCGLTMLLRSVLCGPDDHCHSPKTKAANVYRAHQPIFQAMEQSTAVLRAQRNRTSDIPSSDFLQRLCRRFRLQRPDCLPPGQELILNRGCRLQ